MTKDEKRLNKLLQDYCDPEEDFSGVASDLLEYGDLKFVVHAHWNEDGRCTNCGEHAPFYAMASTYHKSKYCHGCGAQMDEISAR